MARKLELRPDKNDWNEYLPGSPPPEWMDSATKINEKEAFNPVLARALYISEFGTKADSQFLELLIASEEMQAAESLAEAFEIAYTCYPEDGLRAGERVSLASPSAKTRARFLRILMSKLLETLRVPSVIRRDLDILLAGYHIKTEENKKRVQQLLIDNPSLSYGEMSRMTETAAGEAVKIDKSDLSQQVIAGLLLDPHKEARPSEPEVRRGTTLD